jgi:hypothetical protein
MQVNTADIQAFKNTTSSVVDQLKGSIDPKFIEKVIKAAQ